MSEQKKRLCVLLLEEYFGDVAGAVGSHLSRWQNIPISGLTRHIKRARLAVSALINHHMVRFRQGVRRADTVEYSVDLEQVLLLLRYPRYMYLAKSMLGGEAELLIEELLKIGQDVPENLILRSAKRLGEDAEEVTNSELAKLHEVFCQMVRQRYLERCPDLNPLEVGGTVPSFVNEEEYALQRFTVPLNIDIKNIHCMAKDGKELSYDAGSLPLFRVNFEQFHRAFRDQIIVSAVTRRIDASAGHLMRIFLSKVDVDRSMIDGVSNHIYLLNVMEEVNSVNCTDVKLRQFREHYVKVLEEDRTRFVDKVGNESGGMYVINFKHIFGQLAAATMDNVVFERFGSKALRIFRVIKEKKYIEESQIQGIVMIPTKETKSLTYQLLENNFIHLQELRKSMVSSTPSKSFYLFYVDLNHVARMLLELSYKSLVNLMLREKFETTSNQRLLDKQDRIESLTANLRTSGEIENEDQLQEQLEEIQNMMSPPERDHVAFVHRCLDKLGRAVGQVDETLLVLTLFLQYGGSK